MAPLLKCQETKIHYFALWSSISKYHNLAETAVTWHVEDKDPPLILPRIKLRAAKGTESSNAGSLPEPASAAVALLTA